MKKVNYKGLDYDVVVIDNHICLQNLTQDVVFENGYKNVCANLEAEWWKQGAIGSSRDYVLEYEVDAILEYIKDHEGVVTINDLN